MSQNRGIEIALLGVTLGVLGISISLLGIAYIFAASTNINPYPFFGVVIAIFGVIIALVAVMIGGKK